MKTRTVSEFKDTEIGKIPIDWEVKKFSEISEFQYGKMPQKKDVVDQGFPIFSGYKITGYHKKFMYEDEKLIVVARGVGGTGDVKLSPPKSFITNLSIIFELDKKITNAKFLYYYFFRGLRYLDSGSAQSQITINDLKRIKIGLPQLDEQIRITKIFLDIDSKIENLQNQNKVLEQMAQAIFKSWFVDFDGVTEFEDSELGQIPKGWKVVTLGEISNSISKTHSFDKDELIFLNTGDIKSGKILHNDYTFVTKFPGQAKKSIEKNDILFSEIRPKNERYAFVDFDSTDYVVSTKLLVIRTKESIFSRYLYNFLTSKDSLDYLQLIAETRSGTFPQITFDELKILKIIKPPHKILEEYNQNIIHLSSQIKKKWIMGLHLKKIRDFLLPKLMSGEIRV